MSEELTRYKKDGFFIARSLIDCEEIISPRDSIRDRFLDQLKYLSISHETNATLLNIMKRLFDVDLERYKKVVGSLWRMYDVYELTHHQRIREFLSSVFGWEALFMPGGQVIHVMAKELEIPNGYFGLIPHQDFPSVQGSLDGVVIWIPLVDIDSSNYPLELIPGSHKAGVLPSIQSSDSTWQIKPSSIDEREFIPVEVKKGDVVFMSVFTVHRSSVSGNQGNLRLAVSTRYDNSLESTFIERCYPTAYRRTVQREQIVEDFPTPQQVKSIFNE